jgi:diguanylate cyclase (GGDEF)-like protein
LLRGSKDTLLPVSFSRRLAFFFVLLVIVPMLALVSILLFVSQDARSGKADARLAAGVETAIAVYQADAEEGRARATRLARDPGLAAALAGPDRKRLFALAEAELGTGQAAAVEIRGPDGSELATAGPPIAIAFGEVRLARGGDEIGTVRMSTTTAAAYTDEVKRLTGRELVFSRAGAPLASTVTPPDTLPAPGDTVDLELDQDYRARQQPLDPDSKDAVLVLGPRGEGGLLALDRPAVALLGFFLLLAIVSAWSLARTLSALHERVETLAVTDPLTGLWNRRRMGELLEREFERHRRFGRPFSLLIVDVDDFKAINDQYGHPQGDVVLSGLAEIMAEETRAIDEAVRFGGDEFALILSETKAGGASILAERLRRRVRERDFRLTGARSPSVTVSIGAATVPGSAGEPDELVKLADDALLQAKRAGKDRIEYAA